VDAPPKTDAAIADRLDHCEFDSVDARNMTVAQLVSRIILNRPFLIKGLLDGAWGDAYPKFEPDGLNAAHGGARVTLSAIPYAKKFHNDAGIMEMPLSEYIDQLRGHDVVGGDRYPWYVFRGNPVQKMPSEENLDGNEEWFFNPHDTPVPDAIYRTFEALAAFDFKGRDRNDPSKSSKSWEDRFTPPVEDGDLPTPRERMWPFINAQWALGSAGSGAPQHYHNTAWNACVYGLKRWLVYPPAYNLMSNMQIRMWDETDRFDNQDHGQPRPMECIQKAGEIAVIPELWGHGVVNLQETIAIATEVKFSLYRAPMPKSLRLVKVAPKQRGPPERHPGQRPPGARGRPQGDRARRPPPGMPMRRHSPDVASSWIP